jgi:hypothetical protein
MKRSRFRHIATTLHGGQAPTTRQDVAEAILHYEFPITDQVGRYGVAAMHIPLTWDHSNLMLPDLVFDLYGLPVEKGTPLNRRTIMQTTPPSCVTNWNQFFVTSPDFSWKNPGTPIAEGVNAIGVVPADDIHGYHMLAQSTSYPLTEANKANVLHVVGQDVAAFAAVQEFYDNNPTTSEVLIGIDKSAVLMRRIIDKMVREEQLEKSGGRREPQTSRTSKAPMPEAETNT